VLTDLSKIQFPVYYLGYLKPIREGNLLYYIRVKNGTEFIEVIDNLDYKEPSLSKRRLRVLGSGMALYRIKKCFFYYADLLKFATPVKYFVDSAGNVFNYRKSLRCTITYHVVDKITRTSLGAVVELKGLPIRFKILHYPIDFPKYASIINAGKAKLLYGLHDKIEDKKVIWL
jgi:hypothetical protein